MQENKMKKAVLSIGIAVLFVLFVGYAIETVYPSPKYKDFCEERPVFVNNSKDCISNGGKWTNSPGNELSPKPVESASKGWCDITFNCRKNFESAEEKYNINLFFITLIIGVITFILSIFLLVEAVSSGFMGGGILVIIYGTLRNWESLSNLWRTLMLGLALAVLVWIGYKKLNK